MISLLQGALPQVAAPLQVSLAVANSDLISRAKFAIGVSDARVHEIT